MAYLKKVRDLTIEDLERMRHLEVLGEEGAFLIEVLESLGHAAGLSRKQIRTLTLEEATGGFREATE